LTKDWLIFAYVGRLAFTIPNVTRSTIRQWSESWYTGPWWMGCCTLEWRLGE